MPTLWTDSEIQDLSREFGIHAGRQLLPESEDFHFPDRDFLACGYAPPGGYVKDFGIIRHLGRFHLFHIDGRPGEICWITGNEISFGHASTSDFRRWIRHPMPLAVGDRAWENEHVWAPFVYRHDDLFYLFYMGNGGGRSAISYATSPDLERWTRWTDGPVPGTEGRDPFVYRDGDRAVLLYTGHGGARVAASSSRDMTIWQPEADLLNIPDGAAAESPSLHPLGDGFVLWFNDYGPNLAGFRAAYALSPDRTHFDPATIREFDFHTDAPDVVPSRELPVTKPFPLSIELIARGEEIWLVSYFRWQDDRNRLFFGALDWSQEPAQITEILRPEDLIRVLALVGLSEKNASADTV